MTKKQPVGFDSQTKKASIHLLASTSTDLKRLLNKDIHNVPSPGASMPPSLVLWGTRASYVSRGANNITLILYELGNVSSYPAL